MRRIVQAGFVVLTVVGVFVVRGNAERWCPFGGVEALYSYIKEGNLVCSLAVSNFYILGGVLLMTLLLRRAFCGYMCPIGSLSEWLRSGAARLGLRAPVIPAPLDRGLALLKYVVLGVVLFITWRAGELLFRGFDPCYALISRHGEDITLWSYIVLGVIVLGSLAVMLPFCRWLCPLAAVLNPFSRFGLARIHREAHACTGCRKCARVCPMAIPVDQLQEVTAARCLSCMECVEACPTTGRGAVYWGVSRRRWSQSALVAILLLCTTSAVAMAYVFPLPSFVYAQGTLPAETESVSLRMSELTCRGRANLLVYYLQRDDEFELAGYLKLQAWPAPGTAEARITFDPQACDLSAIRQAITEPYYDAEADFWRIPPFIIESPDADLEP